MEDIGGNLVVETEPIFASLANVLKSYRNLDKVPPALSKFHLEELEVKLGVIQLCEALVFAHSSAQMTHLNINPESIFLTVDGTWKIGAFNWAQFSAYQDRAEQLFAYPEQDVTELIPTRPLLDYVAPECVFLNRFDAAADIFSLGCVVFELFTGAPLLQCRGNAAAYKRQMQQLYPLTLDKVPHTLRVSLEQLLVVDPSKRLTAAGFLQSEFFNDLTIRVLHYISHILEKDDRSKADFFKGLLTALPQFELTVIERKILPALVNELKNLILVPFLLPCLFTIVEMVNSSPDKGGKSFFQTRIFPHLLPLFTIKEPIQVALLLLQRVDLLAKGLNEKEINEHIATLFCFALDHDSLDLKLAALKVGPPIFGAFTYDKLRNALLPRLENILSSATVNSAVRVGCLSCFSRMIPLFSRNIVEEQLLPIVLRSNSVDRNPAVQMATAGVCDVISKKFGEEITAIRVRCSLTSALYVRPLTLFVFQLLPLLIPTSVDPNLNKQQFDTFFEIISSMLERIATSRRKALDEQQKLRDKDESQKKMEDYDRFHRFSQQLESPDVSVRTQRRPASPPVAPAPPVDAKKADSFAELMQKAERSTSASVASRDAGSLLELSSPAAPAHSPAQVLPAATFSDPFGSGELFTKLTLPTKPSSPTASAPSGNSAASAAADPFAFSNAFTSGPRQSISPSFDADFGSSSSAAFASLPAPPAVAPSTAPTKLPPGALMSQLSQLYAQPPAAVPAGTTAQEDEEDFFSGVRPSSGGATLSSTSSNADSFAWGDPFAAPAQPAQTIPTFAPPPQAAAFDFPF